jgi:hypothetical protein
MNSIHYKMVYNVCIYHITSPFGDEFHKEQLLVCLDIVDGIFSPFP